MIWHPEERDKEVNEYLESINHEPWLGILAWLVLLVSSLTVLIVFGIF